MFCAVKRFKDKEGRWPRQQKAEDKREVVLADGKPVLRDLAVWMNNQKMRRDKLDLLREEKLNEIGFLFHSHSGIKRKRQADSSSSSSGGGGGGSSTSPKKKKKKKRAIFDYL